MMHDFLFGFGDAGGGALSTHMSRDLLSWAIMSRELQAVIFQALFITLLRRHRRLSISLSLPAVAAFCTFFQFEVFEQLVQLWVMWHPAFIMATAMLNLTAASGLTALLVAIFVPCRDRTRYWRHRARNAEANWSLERERAGRTPPQFEPDPFR